jgi:hypothetical protein
LGYLGLLEFFESLGLMKLNSTNSINPTNPMNPINPINKIRGKSFSTRVEMNWEKRENHFHFLKGGKITEIKNLV